MREIRLPLPAMFDDNPIEIEIKSTGKEILVQFRMVAFPYQINEQIKIEKEPNKTNERIISLKKSIENYDKSWELIQIFAPLNNSNYINVLFRKK